MTRSRSLRLLPVALLLACTGASAQSDPPACPYKPDVLAKHFGVGFDAGKEEPGLGGTGCRYTTQGGSMAKGTDYSLWVFLVKPGPSQEMMRTMIAGGPKVRFEPIAGDPDGAARARGGPNEDLVDVSYKRGGYVVFLRTSGQGRDNADAMAARLLKLPRLP